MIQPQELRLGNYVLPIMGGLAKVYKISNNLVTLKLGADIFKAKYEDISSITLTEEWLLKFGWGRSDEHELCNNINDIIFIYDYHFKKLYIEDEKHGIEVKNINTVHQLQNLYHALTGKELMLTD